MPSRYLTATAKLFAPLWARPVSLEGAPVGVGDFEEEADLASQSVSTRSWELRKVQPGQSSFEAYVLTFLLGALFFAGVFDGLLRVIPLRDFHLIWMVFLGLALCPLAIGEVALVSALAGDASEKLGFFRKWMPCRRTGFFFQAVCIVYAAWATGEPTFVRVVGYAWLGLVALNTICAVILSARAAGPEERL